MPRHGEVGGWYSSGTRHECPSLGNHANTSKRGVDVVERDGSSLSGHFEDCSAQEMIMEPIPQFQQALEVIKHVCAISSTVRAKKKQCKRLANRFSAIGEGLKGGMGWDKNFYGGNSSDGSDRNHCPALDELLTVLRKGETLVSSYVDSKSISILVGRTDNQESFKEIHEELDTLKAQFDFESSSERGPVKDFEASLAEQMVLTEFANLDLKMMPTDMAQIQDSAPFKRSDVLEIITQIAKGMSYVNAQQYVHKDLKCSNILVKKSDEHLDVKIADLRGS